MTWTPQASVTINGTSYTNKSLDGVQVFYGRSSIWEQPRAGYAVVNVLNATNTDFGFQPNQSVVIKVKDSSGTDVTLFTGQITNIQNNLAQFGTINKVAIQQITAISPLSKMARAVMSGTFAKELDNVRLTSILTASGVTTDTIDAGVYEFQAVTASETDCYTLAAKYAGQAFGYIYDTTDGKVGFASESRRSVDKTANGYFHIDEAYLLGRDLNSNKNLNNLLNDVVLSYRAGTATSEDLTSQASYGIAAGTVTTELHNLSDAQLQADRYITLRATPRTNLGQFSIELAASNVTNSDRNTLLAMRHGRPIEIQSLPTAIKNATFQGFVEAWSFNITQYRCTLSITASDATLSVTPMRWQDVTATLAWSAVGATVQWNTWDDQELDGNDYKLWLDYAK